MSDNSHIEWTDATWNFATGCTKISDGCLNCYIPTTPPFRMERRQFDMAGIGGATDIRLHPERLGLPLKWRKPKKIFVNSLSDLFHPRVPRELVARAFAVMAAAPQHQYQVLTKRPERMARMLTDECQCGAGHAAGTHFRSEMEWAATPHSPTYVPGMKSGIYHRSAWPLPSVWLGTTVESNKHVGRADALRATPAAVRFISAEPLLGPLPSLDLTGIDWLILGGESGPGSRRLDVGWFRELIGMAESAGTAVFVKQLGSLWAQDTFVGGQSLAKTDKKGGDWRHWPADLRIRAYPASGERAVA